jgi:hypothetical protein
VAVRIANDPNGLAEWPARRARFLRGCAVRLPGGG